MPIIKLALTDSEFIEKEFKKARLLLIRGKKSKIRAQAKLEIENRFIEEHKNEESVVCPICYEDISDLWDNFILPCGKALCKICLN